MIDSDVSESETQRRVFRGGLKRKRVEFVPAGRTHSSTGPAATPPLSLSERYLSITLKTGAPSASRTDIETVTSSMRQAGSPSLPHKNDICRTCQGLLDTEADETTSAVLGHEVSLAHQVCLAHSHPPSHLDRNRHGLEYLLSYGWDPDSQLGLGASGSGIRVPVKVKVKHDTVGLGVKMPEWNHEAATKPERLDAKGLRNREKKENVKRQMLQQMFYGKSDLQNYLVLG